jgi:hypothetical protein
MNCKDEDFFGQELILNCKEGNENVTDMEKIREFIDELVTRLKMEKHGDLKIDRFGEGDLIGISCCQFIKTSSIVGHFSDVNRNFYLNIFSCKRFDESEVVSVIRKHFNPTMAQRINLNRGV